MGEKIETETGREPETVAEIGPKTETAAEINLEIVEEERMTLDLPMPIWSPLEETEMIRTDQGPKTKKIRRETRVRTETETEMMTITTRKRKRKRERDQRSMTMMMMIMIVAGKAKSL